jgi:hypothetical protein
MRIAAGAVYDVIRERGYLGLNGAGSVTSAP